MSDRARKRSVVAVFEPLAHAEIDRRLEAARRRALAPADAETASSSEPWPIAPAELVRRLRPLIVYN